MRRGELIAGRFEVERPAGHGGMGTVYRARDRGSGQPVAVKVLHGGVSQTSADRFAREAQVLADLTHPGVVRFVASGRTPDGELFLCMEWLEGMDLAARLLRGRLDVGEALTLARRVAGALGVAHARGVVHRDIKPSNLFLPGGDVAAAKLLDFGIARQARAARTRTHTGITLGTPGYMAPEQARGARELDARADVFSLGCVLFECLTGRAAFVGEHVLALLAKILLEEAPRVGQLAPDVPGPLDLLVTSMLSKDPGQRPRDGAAVAALLESLSTAGGGVPPPAPSLGSGEQSLLCVVLALGTPAMAAPPATSDAGTDATTPLTGDARRLDALFDLVSKHRGHLEPLADGSVVITLSGSGGASDRAAQAARCALAMRELLPIAPMALATGRGVVAGRVPVGEAIDRAARLLHAASGPALPVRRATPAPLARPIHLDEVTAGLLDLRFEVGGSAAGLELRGERELVEATRTLLGRESPCVGRERELSVLIGMFDECASEPIARAALVTAPTGVGKSRLRYELLRKIRQRGEPLEVWMGRGEPMIAGAPFSMIAPAIRRAAGVLDGEPLDVRRRKLRARLARHLAGEDLDRVTEFVGELASVPFPDESSVQLRAARQNPMLMGDQMRRAFEDLIAAEAGAQPLLIVLEDLHWGDLPSVKFLDAALRNVPDRPWMVLALARPEIDEIFPKLWSERGVEVLRLHELTRRASEKFVRQVLGSAASDEVTERLVARAAGNAFYLEELIRAVAEGKGEALPGTVLAMVQSRLEALDPDARRVLRAASVFGQVFWEGGVMALVGGAHLTGRLSELADREVVAARGEGKFPGEREYVFRHALLLEAAYAMLTDSDRALGHRLAGEWLEAAGESEAVVLAEHFERGGEPGRAVAWYARATEQALEGNDFAATIARAERGRAAGAEGEALGELLRLECEAHRWLGHTPAAEQTAREAMRWLPAGSPRWYAAGGEGARASGRLAHAAELEAITHQLLAAAPLPGAEAHRVIALVDAVMQLLFGGLQALAEPVLAEVFAAEDTLGSDPAVRARINYARGFLAAKSGDTGRTVALIRASVELFEKSGDLRSAGAQRSNLGFSYMEIGAYDEAERALRDALQSARRIGIPNQAAVILNNLGLVLARKGLLAEARAVEEEAVEALRAQGDRRLEGSSRSYLALILLFAGDAGAAEREARAAVAALDSAPSLLAHALAILAAVLLASGRPAEALEHSERVVGIAAKEGLEEGEALCYLTRAEALHGSGHEEAARVAIAAARDRLLARAARIEGAEARESFLTRVRENARTLELAREWLASG